MVVFNEKKKISEVKYETRWFDISFLNNYLIDHYKIESINTQLS